MFEWNDYLAIMYAEMHRYSSGRISLNEFKKMVTTNDPYLKAFDRYSKLALEENSETIDEPLK